MHAMQLKTSLQAVLPFYLYNYWFQWWINTAYSCHFTQEELYHGMTKSGAHALAIERLIAE